MRKKRLSDHLPVIFFGVTGLVFLALLAALALSSLFTPPSATLVVTTAVPPRAPTATPPRPTPPANVTPTVRPTNTRVIRPFPDTIPTSTQEPTYTPTPSLTPSPQATPSPTLSPSPTFTPSPTRSKYPFVAEIAAQTSPWDCTWAGIMGGVYDLEGQAVVGHLVHVEGDAGIDVVITSGSSELSSLPGFDASAWSVTIDATGPTAGVWRVQLYMPRTHAPISDVYEIRLKDTCDASSYFVKFVQNH